MAYRVRFDPAALRHIEDFAAYLHDYSEDFAIEQIERLDRIIALNVSESPLTWGYFAFTGAPYRAYLFRVGGVRSIGLSTRSTKRLTPSTFCTFGTPCAIRRASKSRPRSEGARRRS